MMSGFAYALVCPAAYLAAGGLKFVLNSIKARRLAFDKIGLGGMPSTHSAIASAPGWLIALIDGINNPAFAVAVGVLLIVALDALDLRRKLEKVHHILKANIMDDPDVGRLRDRVGHRPSEVVAGIATGAAAAVAVKWILI